MKATQTPDYVKPVRHSVDQLMALYNEMLDDLDEDRHGFSWWHGHLDVPRIAIMSEYLISSVNGAQQALTDAAFALNEFNEQTFAHDHWQQGRIASVGTAPGDESIFRALSLDKAAEKRERRIRLHSEHFFYHVAQSLDRLAAIILGVGALPRSLLRADWGVLTNLSLKEGRQPAEGIVAQDELLSQVLATARDAGPQDWLSWTLAERNTNAHRAPRLGFIVMTRGSRQKSSRLVHILHRQPQWSDTEIFAAQRRDQHLSGIFLIEDPADVMTGVLKSLDQTCSAITALLRDFWSRRRASPQLLIQPGSQWPKLNDVPLQFEGYNAPMPIITEGTARVSPDMGKRMKASGLFSNELWE